MKKYPFKFLDPYTKEDRDIFFGREEEVNELYRMVFQTNLMLLYGASGTGKTSLIRCGLANRFKDSQWLDLYIRRGTDINQSLLSSIKSRIPQAQGTVAASAGSDWFDQLVDSELSESPTEIGPSDPLSDHPVAQALNDLYLATFTPIYLIFDQFEELYTLGQADEQAQLTDTLAELVQLPIPLKIIIVMREEYLARLYELERRIPQLRNKKLRIEPMGLPQVERLILQATVEYPASLISLESGREQAIAQAIVEKIREGDVNVKLPYLQVFIDRLYETATGEATDRDREATFTLDMVNNLGNIGDVLTDFIDRQSRRIQSVLAHRHAALPDDFTWRLLSPFATLDGTKVPLRTSELHRLQRQLPAGINQAELLIKDAIAELENSRILRYRKDEQTYEVAHDTLAKQIAEKRSEEETAYLKARRIVTQGQATYADTRTFLSREQLAYIYPYLHRLQSEVNEEQLTYIRASQSRRKRQQRLLWSGVVLAFALALFVILLVVNEQQKTQRALDDLKRQQAVAKAQELKTFGDSYRDLGKLAYACASYQAGLDTLRAYPELPLFQTLQNLRESCE